VIMGRTRLHVRLPDDEYQRLRNIADRHETTLSAIVSAALDSYIDPKDETSLDDMLLRRMNKFDEKQAQIEHDQAAIMQMLARFVFYWLTRTDPLPEGDRDAAHALGQQRYDFFMDQVTKEMAQKKYTREE